MPKLTRLARVVRLVTLPATRAAIVTAAHSDGLRDMVHRARTDRRGLLRDVRNPAHARDLAQSAARHPATRELATAGLMFLPVRYVPVGWVATWLANKALRRYGNQQAAMSGEKRPATRLGRTAQ